MTTSQSRSARFGLALLGAGMLLAAAPAAAQTGNPAMDRPADQLSRNLRSLAENPNSLHALMGAGTAALALGDAQAAITFFARAEEQAPRDGRVKMWIGAALVQLQQPKSALRFFRDARLLGVAEADIARERGLAYDISGDPAAAQRDYRLALQKDADPELARRLALSLGISGQREAALQLLEDQLLRRDPAAERSKALILALTGDSAGAARAVQTGMPGPQAAAMTPFLARLPLLTPAERALAVHLGVFPGDARTPPPQTYAAFQPTLNAGAPDTSRPSLARRTPPPEPVSTAPRRRPGSAAAPAASQPAAQASTTASSLRQPGPRVSGTQSARDWSRGSLTPSRARSQDRRVAATPQPAQSSPPVQTAARPNTSSLQQPVPTPPVQIAARTAPAPVEVPPAARPVISAPVETAAALPTWTPPAVQQPQVPPPAAARPLELAGVEAMRASPAPQPAPREIEPAPVGRLDADATLAALSATVASLAAEQPKAEEKPKVVEKPAPQRRTAAAAAPIKTTPAAKKPAAKKPAAKKPGPKPVPAKPDPANAEPSRYWVQVAGGANKAALPREYARLKAKAAAVFGNRTAWTTPLNATNRLLVGPFKSNAEAQDFVNELAKADLSAFAWKSEAGQKIEKLSAK